MPNVLAWTNGKTRPEPNSLNWLFGMCFSHFPLIFHGLFSNKSHGFVKHSVWHVGVKTATDRESVFTSRLFYSSWRWLNWRVLTAFLTEFLSGNCSVKCPETVAAIQGCVLISYAQVRLILMSQNWLLHCLMFPCFPSSFSVSVCSEILIWA